MAHSELDRGRLWWPAGLPAQETVRITFNLALKNKPHQISCEDYESQEPFEVEAEFVQEGFGQWSRWTGARLRFVRPEQRGRAFRWRVFGEE